MDTFNSTEGVAPAATESAGGPAHPAAGLAAFNTEFRELAERVAPWVLHEGNEESANIDSLVDFADDNLNEQLGPVNEAMDEFQALAKRLREGVNIDLLHELSAAAARLQVANANAVPYFEAWEQALYLRKKMASALVDAPVPPMPAELSALVAQISATPGFEVEVYEELDDVSRYHQVRVRVKRAAAMQETTNDAA